MLTFTKKTPIVCLVGGVGVTPALAICRSLVHEKSHQRLHIDYSAPSKKQFVCAEELQAAQDMKNITVNLRATKENGRLTSQDVERLAASFPDADFFICEPPGYTDNVRKYLRNTNIPESQVHVEEFLHVGGRPVTQSKDYVYLGLLFLLAFLAQDMFQLKWPWLESLQKAEDYRIGSGLFLACYILAHFVLPVARWSRNFAATTR